MKNLLSRLTLLFLFFTFSCNFAFCAVSKQINANIKTKRVHAGQVISLKMLDPIGSNRSVQGDEFALMVTDNIKVDNIVVIPQGSVVRGSVETVQAPKILYKGGVIRLYFDHIVSSTGKQIPFYAGICHNPNVTFDGALGIKTSYIDAFSKTAENTKDIVVKSTLWAWDKGDELWNGSPKYVFAPVASIVSAPVAGVYFIGDSIADIFKKGKNITVNQGEIIDVQLLKPLDMPVY